MITLNQADLLRGRVIGPAPSEHTGAINAALASTYLDAGPAVSPLERSGLSPWVVISV